MEILVMLFVKHVLPVPLPILEQVPGQQHVLLAPPARIHYRRTLLPVRPAVPDPLQILEPVPGQPRVLLAPLARIHYRRTLQRVQPVPPLPTPPLFIAPLVPIKQLQPVTRDIMEILVMPLVNRAVPESGAPRLVLRRTLSVKHVYQARPV